MVGVATPSFRKWTAAVSAPATYRAGADATETRRLSGSSRSPSARSIAARAPSWRSPMYRITRFARSTRAAVNAPSSTACGLSVIRCRSLRLRGSPSAPLTTMTAFPRDRSATAPHFIAVGKAAPPRPTSLSRSIWSMKSGPTCGSVPRVSWPERRRVIWPRAGRRRCGSCFARKPADRSSAR